MYYTILTTGKKVPKPPKGGCALLTLPPLGGLLGWLYILMIIPAFIHRPGCGMVE